ncbi:hypothetical protein [Halomicronema sp. CCY15110]|uniref:hypothetical protein n=1 Tax=Halomicronema sp. CCY15110 TaxID=2767773 RepID=UPI00194E3B89|nr:hypothetical protein [Halomicronema sp. CCY15110]
MTALGVLLAIAISCRLQSGRSPVGRDRETAAIASLAIAPLKNLRRLNHVPDQPGFDFAQPSSHKS